MLGNVSLLDDRLEATVDFGDVFAQRVVERIAKVVDALFQE